MIRSSYFGILINLVILNFVQSAQNSENPINLSEFADTELPTTELITKEGYPVETHVVTTDDGYLLTLYRIPGSGPGVFLQHGLTGSSDDWLLLGKNHALAYLLADLGYDVWLGNARGNVYSRAHKTLSPTDAEFWDFSFHEMGIYDVPAAITYITNKINGQLIYIGFSMGTTTSYIMAIKRPDISARVKLLISLGPATYMGYMKSPVRIMGPFINQIQSFAKLFGWNEFSRRSGITKIMCGPTSNHNEFCKNIMSLITGFDSQQIDKDLLPIVLGHAPSGTSMKTMIHFLQQVNSGRFCEFDYGRKLNLERYNSTAPPSYDLTNVNIPTALFYSDDDWFATSESVEKLWPQLPSKVDKIKINYPKFYHLNFLFSNIAKNLVYDKLISLIKSFA